MRQVSRTTLWLLAGLASLWFPLQVASAHHSFALFDPNAPVEVTGTVTRLEWSNPHVHLYIDRRNKDDTVEHWVFEMHSVNDMKRSGWNRDTVKVADVVTAHGARERSGATRAFLDWLMLPDGRKVFELKGLKN
jgi:hypothetical protein